MTPSAPLAEFYVSSSGNEMSFFFLGPDPSEYTVIHYPDDCFLSAQLMEDYISNPQNHASADIHVGLRDRFQVRDWDGFTSDEASLSPSLPSTPEPSFRLSGQPWSMEVEFVIGGDTERPRRTRSLNLGGGRNVRQLHFDDPFEVSVTCATCKLCALRVFTCVYVCVY